MNTFSYRTHPMAASVLYQRSRNTLQHVNFRSSGSVQVKQNDQCLDKEFSEEQKNNAREAT